MRNCINSAKNGMGSSIFPHPPSHVSHLNEDVDRHDRSVRTDQEYTPSPIDIVPVPGYVRQCRHQKEEKPYVADE